MNLFKKATASVALVALVSGLFSTGVSAASGAQIDAANALAADGIINNHSSDVAAYNLDQNVLRQEIAAVARGVAGLAKSTSVKGTFADVTATSPNTWAVYSVEPLADAGIVSTSNANFNPERNISKAEALGMMVSAADLGYSFDSSNSSSWQEQVVAFAVEKGIVSNFTDYDTSATRGWVFKVGADSMGSTDDDDDLLGDLLGDLGDDEDDMTDDTTDTTDDTTTVISGDNVLTVSLSPETPAAATVPGSVNGLPVASFDFTAGSEDVTVTQVTVKRRGLSDSATLTSLAVYTDEGRASNEKNDNQENDTEAQLNLSDGGLVVKAGETRTVSVVVDLGTATAAGQDEFALELVSVVTNSNIEGLDNLVANTMRVGSVDAPEITFTPGSSVSNPTLGEEGVDIFEFEIDGASDEDVLVKSITFEGSNNSEDDLANFELYFGNDLVASTASMNGDYLKFDLGDGILVREDKNEDFTVKADIIEGAGDSITFYIDEALDVTAESTKFGYGAAIDIDAVDASGDLGTVTLEAGELTIIEIEADFDEVREDKNNVVLGGFKLNNVAGENLELQEFGIRIVLTAWNATLPANATGSLTVNELFDDVELYNEETGSSYELQLNGTDDQDAVFSENSIDVVIPQGSTVWSIRADTAEDVNNFDTASFELSFTTGNISATTGGFYVEETDDDTEVTDISPSSISFNSIDGSESGATASLEPLSDVTVVRGAKDLAILQWEVEAEESSFVTVDEVVAKITASPIFSSSNLPQTSISEAKLYKGSVSEANLLDQQSGSKIAADGTATFNDFNDVTIAANATETFIITLSFVDGTDTVTNSPYSLTLTSISVEDDDNDDVAVTTGFTSARDVTVTGFGEITISEDSNNEDNEDAKTILAGSSQTVFSVDVQSINESMDVEEVIVTLTWASMTDFKNGLIDASLYLDDVLIDTNSNADITAASASGTTLLTFDSLDGLIIEEATSELKLKLNTATIGYQKLGKTLTGLTVTHVALQETEGVDSGKDAADVTLDITSSSQAFSIVPGTVTPSVAASLNSNATPQVKFSIDLGDNTVNESNSTPNVVITELVFSNLGTSIAGTGVYKISNLDDSSDTATWTVSGDTVTFDVSTLSSTNKTIAGGSDETFKVTITGTAEGDTVSLQLLENGTTYTVTDSSDGSVSNADSTGLTTNLSSELELGSRSY